MLQWPLWDRRRSTDEPVLCPSASSCLLPGIKAAPWVGLARMAPHTLHVPNSIFADVSHVMKKQAAWSMSKQHLGPLLFRTVVATLAWCCTRVVLCTRDLQRGTRR